jgi:hypothetical protein
MAYLVLLSGERSRTALSPSVSNLGPAALLAGVGVILKNGLMDLVGKIATEMVTKRKATFNHRKATGGLAPGRLGRSVDHTSVNQINLKGDSS